ncbi:MAG: sulfatase-like hydrolase/transferase, partial [Candidatus Hydrogenedentes bacterium]|nr:sulfatase-like hydrolase/transferase [Candidatus Hydrogenedentota bacterium]
WIALSARPDDAPFFLFLHYMDPHDPFRDPERPGKGYARVQLGNPDPEKYLKAFQRSYKYEIEYMDTHVGRLLDGLRERDLYDDTLIVFTADHGEEFFEHGGWWHGLSLYDEQIAIPLIMKLPGNAMAGTVNTDLVRHVDIAPTVARVAGQPEPEMWQGQSLLTENMSLTQTPSGHVYAHLDFEGIVLRALRTQEHKLIQANESNKRNYAPVEFYSLTDDPQEQENLAGQSIADDILTQMQKTIDEMHAFILENAAEPTTLDMSELSSEELEQLESLGYVE